MQKLNKELEQYSGKMKEFLTENKLEKFCEIRNKLQNLSLQKSRELVEVCREFIRWSDGIEDQNLFYFEEEVHAQDDLHRILSDGVPKAYFKACIMVELDNYHHGVKQVVDEALVALEVSEQCISIAVELKANFATIAGNERKLLKRIHAIDKQCWEKMSGGEDENIYPFRDVGVLFTLMGQYLEDNKAYQSAYHDYVVLSQRFETDADLVPETVFKRLLRWAQKSAKETRSHEFKLELAHFSLRVLICSEIDASRKQKVSPYFLDRIRSNLLSTKTFQEGLAAIKAFPFKNEPEEVLFLKVEQHCQNFTVCTKSIQPKIRDSFKLRAL